MKTLILAPALGLAALTLAACGPKTEVTNNSTETVALNEEGDAGLDNGATLDAPALGNEAVGDNTTLGEDNALAPAPGNAL